MQIWREKPGVISEKACWVATYGCWLHTGETLFGLLCSLIFEWKQDRHLVG